MFRNLVWLGIVTALGISSIACVSAQPDVSEEEDEHESAQQELSKAVSQSSHEAGKSSAKVDICHIPPGNPANAHTISVAPSAVPAHLAHGDTIGDCSGAEPAGTG